MVPCTFTPNPTFDDKAELNHSNYLDDLAAGRYICPITLLEMNGKHAFGVIRKTGLVVSLKAVKEVPEACGDGVTMDDIITLAPTKAQFQSMQQRMEVRQRDRYP